MYLEKEDVLVDRQMLRVQSKTRCDEKGNVLYEYKAKANSEREVPISKELMQRIVNHMNDPARPDSRLVFCTSSGRPDTHFWDKPDDFEASRNGRIRPKNFPSHESN